MEAKSTEPSLNSGFCILYLPVRLVVEAESGVGNDDFLGGDASAYAHTFGYVVVVLLRLRHTRLVSFRRPN